MDTISGSIAPLIPVILGCGMVKILLLVLDMAGVSSGLPTYKILTIIGEAGYYFTGERYERRTDSLFS